MSFWEDYENWKNQIISEYNKRFSTDINIGNVDICEDGSIFEGNLSWVKGFTTWEQYQKQLLKVVNSNNNQ